MTEKRVKQLVLIVGLTTSVAVIALIIILMMGEAR